MSLTSFAKVFTDLAGFLKKKQAAQKIFEMATYSKISS